MRKVIGFFFWALTASYCFGTTNLWTGAGGDGLWSNPANWSTGEIPTMEDHVEIVAPGTYTVTIDTQAGAASIVVGGTSGQQTLHPQERVDAASLTVRTNGALMLTSPSFLFAAITNQGTIHVAGEQVLVGRNLWNEGIIQAAANQGKVALIIENAEFTNQGTIAIGTNTTLLLGSSSSQLGSPVSVGEGVLQLTGNNTFEGETSFRTDVLFTEGSITGHSSWTGPGKFIWGGGALEHGSVTLSSNFNFRILGEATIPPEMNNFSITNYGTIAVDTGAEVVPRSLNPEASFTNWTDRIENHGAIVLPSEYCRLEGIVNRGNIVSTNGWVQLQSRTINANAGGTFTIGTDSEIEIDDWQFYDHTSVTGGGKLTLDGGLITGSGTIAIDESVFKLAFGRVIGDYTWQGSGRLAWINGELGNFDSPQGSTTFAAGFRVDVQGFGGAGFAHNLTNFGQMTVEQTSLHSGETACFVNGGSLTLRSNATLGLLSFENNGVINQTNSSIVLTGNMTNNGTLNFHSGTIGVQPIFGTCVGVGDCPPASGAYVAGLLSQHRFTVGGYQAGTDYPQIVCGQFTAGGSVHVSLSNDFAPTNRSTFRFALYTNLTTRFEAIDLPTLPEPTFWETMLRRDRFLIRTKQPGDAEARVHLSYMGDATHILNLESPYPIPYHLEVSTNLVDWVTITTRLTNSAADFPIEPQPQRFYRIFEP